MRVSRKAIDTYNSYVIRKDEGCWSWLGTKERGYGRFMALGKIWYAHRLSWILTNGKILNNLFVLHKCDNPQCSNPDHLFLGTQTDNMNDRWSKGRKGDVGRKPLFSPKIEKEIVDKYKSGNLCQWEIAAEYQVTQTTIHKILKRNAS